MPIIQERVEELTRFTRGDMIGDKEVAELARDLFDEKQKRLNLRNAFLRYGKHTPNCKDCDCGFNDKVIELT